MLIKLCIEITKRIMPCLKKALFNSLIYVPGVTSKEVIDKITDDFGASYEVIFKYVL